MSRFTLLIGEYRDDRVVQRTVCEGEVEEQPLGGRVALVASVGLARSVRVLQHPEWYTTAQLMHELVSLVAVHRIRPTVVERPLA